MEKMCEICKGEIEPHAIHIYNQTMNDTQIGTYMHKGCFERVVKIGQTAAREFYS